MSTPTVAIIEDHLLLAETLQSALTHRGIEATVCSPDALDAMLARVLDLAPDLVLLGLDLGAFGDSTELVAALTAGGIRVLVVTGVTERLRIALAIERGAIGFHSKALGFDALVATASAALAGACVLDPALRIALLQELARARADQQRSVVGLSVLTDREQGTLQALAEGRSVHEIASDWVVSEATVRTHVRGVLVKLGVASQLAAVAEARRNGWLTPLVERRRVRLTPR
jgi:two-component system nitrate/nitrite response regulator NarL